LPSTSLRLTLDFSPGIKGPNERAFRRRGPRQTVADGSFGDWSFPTEFAFGAGSSMVRYTADAPLTIAMIQGTYFVTARAQTPLFQTEQSAGLFLDVMQSYRLRQHFLVHAFVVMPDHFHIILTPAEGGTLEKCVQYLKGGFSFRAKKELAIQREIWQPKYHDRRIRDGEECAALVRYVEENPVKRGFVETASDFFVFQREPAVGGRFG